MHRFDRNRMERDFGYGLITKKEYVEELCEELLTWYDSATPEELFTVLMNIDPTTLAEHIESSFPADFPMPPAPLSNLEKAQRSLDNMVSILNARS